MRHYSRGRCHLFSPRTVRKARPSKINTLRRAGELRQPFLYQKSVASHYRSVPAGNALNYSCDQSSYGLAVEL